MNDIGCEQLDFSRDRCWYVKLSHLPPKQLNQVDRHRGLGCFLSSSLLTWQVFEGGSRCDRSLLSAMQFVLKDV